jgi:hypothetical protein
VKYKPSDAILLKHRTKSEKAAWNNKLSLTLRPILRIRHKKPGAQAGGDTLFDDTEFLPHHCTPHKGNRRANFQGSFRQQP